MKGLFKTLYYEKLKAYIWKDNRDDDYEEEEEKEINFEKYN